MQETAAQYTERLLSYSKNEDGIALQESTPKKIAALIEGRGSDALTKRPAPDKWSVAEIVAHLADAELAVSWRLRQVLSKNAIPLQAYDQDAWAATFDYARRDPKRSLATFQVLRENNLALLKAAPPELWNNYGVHEERGNESVAHMVRMIAGHDINHLRQIEQILQRSRS